ncbi:hypothetical protein PF005_g4948 [Phytophthora fragariae]|uniref:Uncharacterized protein n=1 Tax=Phytophthora fragariae TaxID=53985 RepID=A0A6A3SEF4_9STRA|nr:hypothetical protein PF003_g30320 [Phytophthora fragariae]KAE8939094.1 hypothetical protein PF009_g11054 [Phytophthora fragariae]KAE9022066.1 hypothetical protein PF011_g4645 [Phytophthora fragariae]KAE9109054.1 hypothetical protein PF010_g11683 [Phytophthora fragariae]KAE9115265.1 hypothetical protein PF007_g10094 [Phytophthora fragariae]
MTVIYKEPQTSTWTSSSTSLCDIIRIPGRGVRFPCTSRDVAAKLGGVAVLIFGSDYIFKAASMLDRMYYVNLENMPSDLDDDAIYDVFEMKGLTPLITPTFKVGTLTPRDRTVWFNTAVCSSQLMVSSTTALRVIIFDGFDRLVFFNTRHAR